MLNKKVIATQITNLTDARYFAARGVDFLLFETEKLVLDKIIEIAEWVSGPQILLVFDVSSIPNLDEMVIKLSPYGIALKDTSLLPDIAHLQAHVNLFHLEPDKITVDEKVYCLINSIEGLNQLDRDSGIIVKGSEENDVGIKNYDHLDEIFDLLEKEE